MPSRRSTIALATIASTPLFLGGFAPFTWTAAGCAVAAAAWRTADPALAGTTRRLVRLALAVLALGLLQLLPLPTFVEGLIAPGALEIERSLGRGTGWTAISRDPAATREALLGLLVATVLLVTGTRVAASRSARRLLFVAVIAAAAAVALLGVVESFLGRPLLRTDLPEHARPFGPFANRNHAAALLLLALPCAAGLARDLDLERRRHAAGALFFLGALLLLALVLNGSRGGLLAALVLIGAVALRARGHVGWKIASAFLLAAVIAIPGAAWARRHELTTIEERVNLASDAMRMVRDAPVAGIGLGAFGAAYPPHQTVARDLRFRHVECEPVELFVEGGILLGAIGLVAAASILAACLRVLWRPGVSWTDAGAALGVVAVLAHACCDFPLRIPGVALPLLLVLGGVLAQEAADRARTEPAR